MKSYFTSFIHFFLFGNIFVSLSTVALVYNTCIQSNIDVNKNIYYLYLVFFSTLFVYNFQRIFYKSVDSYTAESIRREWIEKKTFTVQFLCILGAVGVFFLLLFKNNYLLIIYLSPLFILSILYFSFAKLRQSAWAKLITLVFVWVMVTAVVPISLFSSNAITISNFLHITMRFCFMMAICIPFDIRDLQVDAVDNVITLPHKVGERKAKGLALLFIILYVIFLAIQAELNKLCLAVSIALFFSALFAALFIVKTSPQRNEYFFVAGLDGTMLVQGVFVLIATCFC